MNYISSNYLGVRCFILDDFLFLHIRVGAQNGLCQVLCLVAQSIHVIAFLAVAEHNTHSSAHVSLWLTEDADAGVVFLQGIEHVVVQWLGAFLWREDDGRTADVLQVDSGDRQAHHGTEVELKLAQIGGVTEGYHTRIVWTRAQLREDHLALLAQEELYAPESGTRQCLGHFAGNVLSLLQCLLWEVEWLPALTVVTALLYVADRWAEEGRTILLGYGEQGEL